MTPANGDGSVISSVGGTGGPVAGSQWIYRKLGTQEVWARADDTEQASYVHGTLVTCARSANCASGIR
jgi:hypothetical protein